ncbi:MAG TPA: cell wall hydrolase [Woeseiaceae bacterium]|nr:cell wall hydrolase [Woeseiaceae bacterium]
MRLLSVLVLAAAICGAKPAAAAGTDTPRELRCLALTVYWEARSRTAEGQSAVAHVVLNRVASAKFPDTICGVVRQGGERPLHRCQFSWWCDGKSDRPFNAAAWRRSVSAARKAMAGGHDPTGGALYFHNTTVKPAWIRRKIRTVRIGDHIFYR